MNRWIKNWLLKENGNVLKFDKLNLNVNNNLKVEASGEGWLLHSVGFLKLWNEPEFD